MFLFFESAFGICLGCLFYGWFYKEKAQYCPGEICEVKARHEIQKTSWKQVAIVVAFIAFAIAAFMLFKTNFSQSPVDLWDLLKQ